MNLELNRTSENGNDTLYISPIDNNEICISIDDNVDIGIVSSRSYYLSINEAQKVIMYLQEQIKGYETKK